MTTDQRRNLARSVQTDESLTNSVPMAGDSLVIALSTFADSVPAFGSEPKRRDIELRKFWPTEPILASALYSVTIRNAAYSWALDGPPSTVEAVQHVLNTSDFGRGWLSLVVKLTTDMFSQDNAAFMEVIRETDRPDSPVLSLAHLDTARCLRTGDLETPVIYTDLRGRRHEMQWYQIQEMVEFPSPVLTMRGMQLCAVSRVLRAAQYLKDIGVYNREKISGDNPNVIHLISGVSRQMVSDAMAEHKQTQSDRGYARYLIPLLLTTVDPTATVAHETIDLKNIPDGFNLEDAMRWYINQLALGFGADYQDFAPLPGSNLGSSAQSLILHMKSRGKGPAFFMKTFEYAMNFQGLIPANVEFQFDEQDIAEDTEQAQLDKTVAETMEIHVRSGAIAAEVATQMLFDDGYIDEAEFTEILGAEDVTDDVTVQDTEKLDKALAAMKKRHKKNPKKRKPSTSYSSIKAEHEENLADFGENVRDEIEEDFETAMIEVLAETLEDFERRIGTKGRLATLLGRKQNDPNDVVNSSAFWEGFRARSVIAAMNQARLGAIKAADFVATLGLNVNFDLVNEQVLSFSRVYSNQWIDRLEQTTRNQLRNSITAWQETGLGERGFPDLVKSLEPTFGAKRAKLIATTEVTQIFDEGSRIAQASAGITTQEWQTARDAFVDDEICKPLDGQQFPINEGPRPVKDTHIGCRCARLPVGQDGQTIGARDKG